MNKAVEADIVIIGGGVAGLWTLNRLRQLGYSAILLESGTLGGGQTHKAQGIIHGGMKYALQGNVTSATSAIADMPRVWQLCLEGNGKIDLSNVPILSHHQYLWTTGAIASKLAGFFAGLALKGTVRELDKEHFPTIFRTDKFKGQVYSLDEVVIDVHALIRELVKPNQDAIFKIDPLQESQLKFDDNGMLTALTVTAEPMRPLDIKAQRYIFAAGAGNELLLNKLKTTDLAIQYRPLHMVVVKHDLPDTLYAHCLGLGAAPRITITSHKAHDGKTVWYLGGQIAEEGVKRDSMSQIEAARAELKELFPWVDLSSAEFATFMIDRAEALQPGGKRPDTCFVKEFGNVIVSWPTKLAFAPMLSDQVIHYLHHDQIKPAKSDIRELRAWPIPALAKPIWDQLL